VAWTRVDQNDVDMLNVLVDMFFFDMISVNTEMGDRVLVQFPVPDIYFSM